MPSLIYGLGCLFAQAQLITSRARCENQGVLAATRCHPACDKSTPGQALRGNPYGLSNRLLARGHGIFRPKADRLLKKQQLQRNHFAVPDGTSLWLHV